MGCGASAVDSNAVPRVTTTTTGSARSVAAEKQYKKEPDVEPQSTHAADARNRYLIQQARTSDMYELTKVLGTGGSCTVSIAVDKKLGTSFALKQLDLDPPDADQYDDIPNSVLFRHEVDILSSLKHPNIVEFVQAYKDEDCYNIVTVMCEGGELFDRVAAKTKWTEREAALLTKQMLEALVYCHDRNITHRDLKPENFVFDTQERAANMRLIDFGCALRVDDSVVVQGMAGSAYYVAPEVLDDVKRTGATWRASDMWSIGVIVYLLLNGRPPFQGRTQNDIFARIFRGKYKQQHNQALSLEAVDFYVRLLNMDVKKRSTVHESLNHPWIKKHTKAATTSEKPEAENPLPSAVLKNLGAFQNQNKLRKAVARMLAKRLTGDDVELLTSTFERFDTNKDGKLSTEEIVHMMREIGGTEEDAKQFMEDFDEDGNKALDFAEFKNAAAATRLAKGQTAEEAWKMFDVDGDGVITTAEVEKALNITPDEAKQLIAEVDIDGDGDVNFEEWVKAMGGGSQRLQTMVVGTQTKRGHTTRNRGAKNSKRRMPLDVMKLAMERAAEAVKTADVADEKVESTTPATPRTQAARDAAAQKIQAVFRGKRARNQVDCLQIKKAPDSAMLKRRAVLAQESIKQHCANMSSYSDRSSALLLRDRAALIDADLIDLNAPVNDQQSTLLHIAAWYNRHKTVEFALKHKADPNATNKNGDTPLHVAIDSRLGADPEDKVEQRSAIATIKALLAAGADPQREDNGKQSALDKARLLPDQTRQEIIDALTALQ